MSGGSYDYSFLKIEHEYVGKMFDKELDKMMKDLCKLTKDLEWWRSGDISEDQYRQTVAEFKATWFNPTHRKEVLTNIVQEECALLKRELLQMLEHTP